MVTPYYKNAIKYILEELWTNNSADLLENYKKNIDEYPQEIKDIIFFLDSIVDLRSENIKDTQIADIELGMIALTFISLHNAISRPEKDEEFTSEQEKIFRNLLK